MTSSRPSASMVEMVERLLARFPPLSRTMRASPVPRDKHRAWRELIVALLYGAVCHVLFLAAVIAMIVGMWFGMSLGAGTLASPFRWVANVA